MYFFIMRFLFLLTEKTDGRLMVWFLVVLNLIIIIKITCSLRPFLVPKSRPYKAAGKFFSMFSERDQVICKIRNYFALFPIFLSL